MPIASAGRVISVAASDIDGDGNADLVTAHYDSDTVEVRYGDGLGGFAAPDFDCFSQRGTAGSERSVTFNNDSNPRYCHRWAIVVPPIPDSAIAFQ